MKKQPSAFVSQLAEWLEQSKSREAQQPAALRIKNSLHEQMLAEGEHQKGDSFEVLRSE